ncbi:hypothetical protein EON80_33125 [bacterium]|nr:MAG: hypothetical protein EON80_33125 [bacterium]
MDGTGLDTPEKRAYVEVECNGFPKPPFVIEFDGTMLKDKIRIDGGWSKSECPEDLGDEREFEGHVRLRGSVNLRATIKPQGEDEEFTLILEGHGEASSVSRARTEIEGLGLSEEGGRVRFVGAKKGHQILIRRDLKLEADGGGA